MVRRLPGVCSKVKAGERTGRGQPRRLRQRVCERVENRSVCCFSSPGGAFITEEGEISCAQCCEDIESGEDKKVTTGLDNMAVMVAVAKVVSEEWWSQKAGSSGPGRTRGERQGFPIVSDLRGISHEEKEMSGIIVLKSASLFIPHHWKFGPRPFTPCLLPVPYLSCSSPHSRPFSHLFS